MREPKIPYVLELLKDALALMKIKPSSKNALLAYNYILRGIEDEGRRVKTILKSKD